MKAANRTMLRCPLTKNSIPHQVVGRYGSSQVMLMPANPGTGIIAGACMRAIAESLGLTDVLTKVRGSSNPINVVKAAFDALSQLRSREEIARLREVGV